MRLLFDDIILGGGPNYFLGNELDGLDTRLDNNVIKIPRSDFHKNISDYLALNIKPFLGVLVGDDQEDFRTRKRALSGKLRGTYTFTLEDDYIDRDGSRVVYARYQFTGKIIVSNVNSRVRSNMSRYHIQIFCEDPNLYLLPEIVKETDIEIAGFVFPLIFPFVFSEASLTLINEGFEKVYPEIEIFGPLTNLTIKMNNDVVSNETFLYTNGISVSSKIILTPNPTDPVKVRNDAGGSMVRYSNSNFDALTLQPGKNTMVFSAESDVVAGTSIARLTYKSAFSGI